MARYGEPTDVVMVAEVLALAELKVIAEGERLKLLKGAAGQTEMTRIENLIRHKEHRLNHLIPPDQKSAESWGDDLPNFIISEEDAKA